MVWWIRHDLRLAEERALAACLAIVTACSASGPSSRYVAEHFRTTRTNFVYVRDLGVQVAWPVAGQPTRHDPLELFH